jgi:predicted ferric reductase
MTTPPEEGPRLAFGIKPLGDFTAAAKDVRPGERAWLDGPYGVFSIDHAQDAEGFVFVAGGIGITPVIANLRAMAARGDRRRAVLFYCNKELGRRDLSRGARRDRAAPRSCKSCMCSRSRRTAGAARVGLLDRAILERHLPRTARRLAAFLCGPPPLTRAAREALEALGIPPDRIESELFELV